MSQYHWGRLRVRHHFILLDICCRYQDCNVTIEKSHSWYFNDIKETDPEKERAFDVTELSSYERIFQMHHFARYVNFVVIIYKLFLIVFGYQSTANEYGSCTPRTSFMASDGINICFCPASGDSSGIHCTVKPPACIPGQSVKLGCNSCGCNADGTIGICTKHSCPVQVKCTPGTMYAANDTCNSCICPQSGNPLEACCTSTQCQPNSCQPGESFIGAGNRICTCPYSGTRSRATCIKQPQVCNPGQMYSPDGCNDCICTEDGQQGACTLMVCPKDTCKPGKSFKQACNTCFCPDNGLKADAACTRILCLD